MNRGGVMVWAGIEYKETTDIKFIQGKMNNINYVELVNVAYSIWSMH